ncbi:Eco47II family restriction endonuclease [Myroides odoratimimus]|uniref:Eco47II family restriction endonuclease n=1 Tax=Myroides odoratimimus TaxID=76832 RepID=UPI0031010B2F
MANKYVSFVSDEHLLGCIAVLHQAYVKAKSNLSKQSFYKNKVDSIKLTFDKFFNELDDKELIEFERVRQIDKSINNAVGIFHEQVLGGIKGYQIGESSDYDIKANDNTLYADIKNKHNTTNSKSSEALFQHLECFANQSDQIKCYYVSILCKSSFCKLWKFKVKGKEYSHSRIYKISGDQFYALLTGKKDALYQLYKALPKVLEDYINSIGFEKISKDSKIYESLQRDIKESKRSILDQITSDNYKYYNGFDKL